MVYFHTCFCVHSSLSKGVIFPTSLEFSSTVESRSGLHYSEWVNLGIDGVLMTPKPYRCYLHFIFFLRVVHFPLFRLHILVPASAPHRRHWTYIMILILGKSPPRSIFFLKRGIIMQDSCGCVTHRYKLPGNYPFSTIYGNLPFHLENYS